MSQGSQETNPPVPSTSGMTLVSSPLRESPQESPQTTEFSPEQVRPFPKAQPRRTQTGGRISAILTYTPVKAALENDMKNTKSKKQKSTKVRRTLEISIRKPTNNEKLDDSDDKFNICLVCCEHFRDSRSREKWVQCQVCKH